MKPVEIAALGLLCVVAWEQWFGRGDYLRMLDTMVAVFMRSFTG